MMQDNESLSSTIRELSKREVQEEVKEGWMFRTVDTQIDRADATAKSRKCKTQPSSR